jgi:hypothetical protein
MRRSDEAPLRVHEPVEVRGYRQWPSARKRGYTDVRLGIRWTGTLFASASLARGTPSLVKTGRSHMGHCIPKYLNGLKILSLAEQRSR